ncbi:MAG: DUF3333 domain-containing protein, partial [Alphaproteobacteria bacterium]|nr:DUF3333 domain-containing protein [Alphaproteobacteria bacterium]
MGREIVNIKKRNAVETRFRLLGAGSVFLALMFLAILFLAILGKANGAFWRSEVALEIVAGDDERQIIKDSLCQRFPDAKTLPQINSLYQLVSKVSNLELKKQRGESIVWLSLSSKADMFFKHGETSVLNTDQLRWLYDLKEKNQVRQVFNWKFFTFADSREPEIAGVRAGLVGS